MNEQIKIQPKSSIAYVNIVKKLITKNTEFYAYKLKQERSFKVVLKHIHTTANLDDGWIWMDKKRSITFRTYY